MAAHTFINIILLVLLERSQANSKKYDLEMEASRLYGESFSAVLDRFRRTPAYLSIMKTKHKDMSILLNGITIPIMQNMERQIVMKVAEMVGYRNISSNSENFPSRFLRSYKGRKQNDADSSSDSTVNPVQILDGYELLHQHTSTQERNQFKDLGFEMAVKMAAAVINAMGPVDVSTASDSGGHSTSTTHHSLSTLTETTHPTDTTLGDNDSSTIMGTNDTENTFLRN